MIKSDGRVGFRPAISEWWGEPHPTIVIGMMLLLVAIAGAQRQMENLGRGVVAIAVRHPQADNQGGGKVYVGWRLLGTDQQDISFDLYRSTGGAEPIKLNDQPITDSTNFVDNNVDLSKSNCWFVSGRVRLNRTNYVGIWRWCEISHPTSDLVAWVTGDQIGAVRVETI